jgi:hypothetical protein
MKKAKILFWLIIIGFIGLVIYQNKEFFMTRHSFGIDLMVFSYRSPEVYSAILFLLFFILGLLIAYFFGLFERFKANKTIKTLTATNSSLEQMLASLKNDLASIKTGQTQELQVEADAPDEAEGESPASSQ